MEQDEGSLISHLEALRETLLKCIIALCIVLPLGIYLAPKFLDVLILVITRNSSITFNYFSPIEVFLLQLKTAFVLDFVICFPYTVKKIWDFILPALYDHEKSFIKKTAFFSCLLFILGVMFCIFIIMPMVINFGISFSSGNINPVFGISNVINLTLWMALAFGLMFQAPLITIALIKLGVISYESVSDKRPYVVVLILILAAIFTPPDVVSQLMVGIPTYLLFEAGLLVARKYKTETLTDSDSQE